MADWGDAPTILVFSDSEGGAVTASEGVMANGGRIAAVLPIGSALERLDRQASVDLVILDVSFDHGPLLDQLFRTIEDGAAHRRFSGIVIVAPELVDIATARLGDADVNVLVGRDVAALEQAISERLFQTQPRLHERAEEDDLGRLQFLTDEFGRMVHAGRARRDDDSDSLLPGEMPLEPADRSSAEATVIREIIRRRRARDELFGAGLFADPAWDILLDLTAARIERRSVAVSSLCIAAAVPATTALRWIKQLTEAGLLKRVADPDDGRRVFIELTDRAATAMTAYFTTETRGGRI